MNYSRLFFQFFLFAFLGSSLACAKLYELDPQLAAVSYSVSGSVTGLNGTLTLQNNSTDSLTISIGDSSFTFEEALLDAAAYQVSIFEQPEGQICTVENGNGTIAAANINNILITCTNVSYYVGGTVDGLDGTVILQHNDGEQLEISSDENSFTFFTAVAHGAAYSISVFEQPDGQTCTVENSSGTIAAADVTDVHVVCSDITYTVGGNLSGLVGSVTLRNNGGDNLVLGADGAFAFASPVAEGAAYVVTVFSQPADQTCTLTNDSGIASADITNVSVTCSDNTYTIGGTLTGLADGASVTLRNNGGDNLILSSNGVFTFATQLEDGEAYNATVFSQPSTPHQTCNVTSGAGSISDANVTGISVNCSTNLYEVTLDVQSMATLGIGSDSLEVSLESGGDPLVFAADGIDVFENALPDGEYELSIVSSPTNPHQTCTPNMSEVVIDGDDVTVEINCSVNDYTLRVNVSGLDDGQSVTVASTAGGVLAPITDEGIYPFPDDLADQTSYVVSISSQPALQACSVASPAGTINGSNATVSITCVDTYTIGGTLNGLADGEQVTLQNNAGDDLILTNDGPFTFATRLESTDAYEVTVLTQPDGQACELSNDTGMVSGVNVSNIAVTCASNALSIFMTTGTYDGALGGFSGADAICDGEFDGTKALLAQGGVRMPCNPGVTCDISHNIDWVLLPNTTYYRADGLTEIGTTNSAGIFPFPLDAAFSASSTAEIWTGLQSTWETGFSCGGWVMNSSAVGLSWFSDQVAEGSIVADTFADCGVARRLLCVQQP